MKVTISGSPELTKGLREAREKTLDLLASALYQEGERVMSKSKEEVAVGVDGTLRASGFVRPPKRDMGSIKVELGYGGAAQGYAAAVHEGTRPHMPPVDSLKAWAKKFLGSEKLAWAVAFAISKRGTKATKYLERPLRAEAGSMGDRIARKIKAGLRS